MQYKTDLRFRALHCKAESYSTNNRSSMNVMSSMTVLLNLGLYSPRGSVSRLQGFGGLAHPTCMIRGVMICLASLCTNSVHVCLELEEKVVLRRAR